MGPEQEWDGGHIFGVLSDFVAVVEIGISTVFKLFLICNDMFWSTKIIIKIWKKNYNLSKLDLSSSSH